MSRAAIPAEALPGAIAEGTAELTAALGGVKEQAEEAEAEAQAESKVSTLTESTATSVDAARSPRDRLNWPLGCGEAIPDCLESVLAALDGVPCSWDAVLEVLHKFSLTQANITDLLRRSALKLGFWVPDDALLAAAQQEVQERLAKHRASSGAQEIRDEQPPCSKQLEEACKDSHGGSATACATLRCVQPAVDDCEDPPRWASLVPRADAARPSSVLPRIGSVFERQISPGKASREMAAASHLMPAAFESEETPGYASERRQSITASVHLTRAATTLNLVSNRIPAVPASVLSKAKLLKKDQLLVSNSAASRLPQFKWAFFLLAAFQMVAFAFYPVLYKTPKSWDVIGLSLPIARGSAYGTCFWTGILFLTMSRDLISLVTRCSCVKRSQFAVQLINCTKELHIFSACQVVIDGCIHALMHHVGTFVALEREDTRTLNSVLNCAQDKSTVPSGYIGKFIGNFQVAIQFPPCPLRDDMDVRYSSGMLSTPGITGYLLLAVIFVLGWFSRAKKRRANYRLFFALHHLLVPSWVILLVLHGANDWVGLGFPLVILVAGIPVFAYAWTRLRRVYLSCRHDAGVLRAEKSATGKLLRLDLELMPAYRSCKVGEYAYLNVPEAGRTEWHPYTICSSSPLADGRQKVTFCMMSVGEWTKKVHELFDGHLGRDMDPPKVYVDGPFYAPSVSMPSRSTAVGIGAGVGVTPFLSFLASTAGDAGTERKSTHVFWMSAFATDFTLFKDLLSALDARSASDAGSPTTFHLHATPRFGAWDGTGVGGVFDLAAREVWATWLKRLDAKRPQMEPTFSKYEVPLYAVVSQNLLESRRPLAVAVGSPEWISELLAIGQANSDEDVFVYYCGNDFLKNMIQSACIACNEVRVWQKQSQRYYFYFERFG